MSKGSLGFLFSEIVGPETVFFGDTLEVRGSSFSKIPGNYRVTVQGVPAKVLEVSGLGFKFVLPDLFPIGEKQVTQGLYAFEISVAGKVLELEYPLDFRQANFEIDPNQVVNYEDTLIIEGSYLSSESIEVKYFAENGNEYKLPVVDFSASKIRFMPIAKFQESNPKIQITLRGKKYIVSNSFKLKAPEVDSGQAFLRKTFEWTTLKGKNFNIHYPEMNSLSFGGLDLNYEIQNVSSTNLTFRIWAGNDQFIPRNIEVYPNNSGQNSINSVKLTFTDPVLPFFKAEGVFREDYGIGGGVSMGDYGYFFRVNSIYKFTPSARKMELVAENKNSDSFLANIFTLKSPNGKIYSGGHSENVFSVQSSPQIFEFDPSNNTLIKLPKIPSDVIQPLSVYSTDKYLYYEGGFKITPAVGYVEVNERWRYEFATRTWKKLAGQTEIKDYSLRLKSFWYKGKLYQIGVENREDNVVALQKFDQLEETWITVASFSFGDVVESEVIPIIANEAFIFTPTQIVKINLDTYSESIVQNIGEESSMLWFSAMQVMGINGKIYSTLYGSEVVELDPDYFTY
ncbi:hypothetical protein [Cognataquiflexum rubidum]|uniref:hypothetical protein n=1 Tax=Cognataquiflexum rubidum TaxID=2922273 RepID=UPI001F12CF99|nr:hypothetical protein [Cognataquiflexum rubidum]MCH6232336.1 hypothetical protein [Cognataquiflexum rubidum]